jgi:hypothetical protein
MAKLPNIRCEDLEVMEEKNKKENFSYERTSQTSGFDNGSFATRSNPTSRQC